MKVDYSVLERRWPELLPAAHAASELLKAELGTSASSIRAEWDVDESDPDQLLAFLEISDGRGSVGYRFFPEEFSKADHLKIKLHRLWGDMLMIQSHVGLDDLRWQYAIQEGS
jgi:hypothetical protein